MKIYEIISGNSGNKRTVGFSNGQFNKKNRTTWYSFLNSEFSCRSLWIAIIFFACTSEVLSANYYWRSVPADNIYTNVANWETSPGGGISPSTAPTVNDDIFFPASITVARSISLNGGFCRNFSFSGVANFTFSGNFTINGSLIANGNAYFNIAGASTYNGTSGNMLTFSGSGTHNIDMGTSSQRFSGGGAISFTSNTAGGTYSLINHPWITDNTIRLNTQNFVSNGLQIDVRFMTIEGTATKTINFSNSTINVNGSTGYSDNFFNFDFNTTGTATTYSMTNTRVVANGAIFQMRIQTAVSIGSLTLNNAETATLYTQQATGSILSMDSLIINNAAVYLGRSGFDGPNSTAQTLNIRVIRFLKPSVIENNANTTIGNTQAILETPICQGQSAIQSMSNNTLKFNPSASLTTNGIAYRSVVFGGSGVSASSSFNLGLNSGSVTWTTAVPSTTFYWVGGTGSWNDPTKWSVTGSGGTPQSAIGCTPTYADDVVFDAGSFTAAQTVSVGTAGAYCRNITFSDPANEGLLQSGVLNINGNANFTGARGIASSIRFMGSGSHTITSGTAFTYNSTSIVLAGTGTYMLTDNFTANINTNYFHHLSGTLHTNGKNMTVGQFSSRPFPSISGNVRHINITNSVLTHRNLTSAGAYVFLDISYLGSFTATGSLIVQTDNTRRFRIATVANNTVGNFLTPLILNDISFTDVGGTTIFDHSLPAAASVSYNNVRFASNADITKSLSNHPHIVDTFWVTSGRLYRFTSNSNYTITGGIEHVSTGCGELIRMNSTTAGSLTNLYKAAAPFSVNGAIVKDINASGTTMNIVGGKNDGNNLNVIVSPATGRDMYWVNGTGNWSDGYGHWSIGVSGGNPAVTNPLGCIPRLMDNVFFDDNSFSTSNRVVTVDIDAECKNMLWDANAGNDHPAFSGASDRILNVWGKLELGAGMTAPFNGNINMMGTDTSVNAQSIRTNTVVLNAQLNMNGGGRYDQLDNINFNSGISLNSGRFYTNTHNITAAHLYLDVRTPNAASIANSRVVLNSWRIIPSTSIFYTYYAYHSGTGNWNANGSYIQSNQREVTINNSVAVVYDTIVMNTTNAHQFGSATTENVTAKWIEWRTSTSNMTGNITTERLIYKQSSVNNLQAGRTVLVADTLVAQGSPCMPLIIQSTTSGVRATLNSGRCNINILFGNLKDINSSTCSAAENTVVGTNAGNNVNWTFTNISDFAPLGNDTVIVCKDVPFVIDASGFGHVGSLNYSWNTGAVTPAISVDTAGTYIVTVDYGASCFISDEIVVQCYVPQADLSVQKTVDNPLPMIGDTVRFSVIVSNSGPDKATGVIVTDNIPSGYHFVSAHTSSGSWSNPYWTVNALPVNAKDTMIVTAIVTDGGNYTNIVQVSGNENDPAAANNQDSASVVPSVYITGRIFRDANGNKIVNTGEIFTSLPVPLYIYLVNNAGKIIVDSAHVAPDGSYSIQAKQNSGYTIELSTVQYPVGNNTTAMPIDHTPPAGWFTTGENGHNNTGSGDDDPDGVLAVSTIFSDIIHQNFGIQQPPVANNKTYYVSGSAFKTTPPAGYPNISSPGARYFTISTNSPFLTGYINNGSLTGRDPEDCPDDESCYAGSSFMVRSLYTTTLLYYNFGGETAVRQLAPGDTIKNYEPSKLIIYALEGSGIDIPVGFTYSIVDKAGFTSSPASYTILTGSTLPVNLLYFSATSADCATILNWATASELNNDSFEVQKSLDAKVWTTIGKVAGNGTTSVRNDYSLEDKNISAGAIYYRLKQVDFNGKSEYSTTVGINGNPCIRHKIKVYPNPASNLLTIEINENNSGITGRYIVLSDTQGRDILTVRSVANVSKLDVSYLPAGNYLVRVFSGKELLDIQQVIITK